MKKILLFAAILGTIFAFNGCAREGKQESGDFDEGWNMFQKNPAHTGYAPGNMRSINIILEWKTALNKDVVGGNVYYSPAIEGNVIYIRAKDHLYALDIHNGNILWGHELERTKLEGRFATPIVMDERVYTKRDGKGVEGWTGCLYAFNLEGKLKWKYIAPSFIGGNPTVKNGIIYFVSGDNNLYAVDGNEGVQLWKYRMEQGSYSSPAIADGKVYAGGQDHFFYAIDAKNGRLCWKYKTGYAVNSSPSVYKGIVYFGSFDRYFYALDANNGKVKWKFRFDPEEKIHDCPAIRENTVFFSSDQGTLYSLDAQTGKLRWKRKIGSEGLLSSPVVTDNLVFVGTSDGFVYGLDIETGDFKWSYGTGGGTSSAALYKGRIVVASGYGYIYLFSDQSKSPKVVAPCTIKGKVVDSEDRPINNATITIGRITTFADKDGNYEISVPVEGDILIRAHAKAKDGNYKGSAVVEVTEGKIFIKNIMTSFIEALHP